MICVTYLTFSKFAECVERAIAIDALDKCIWRNRNLIRSKRIRHHLCPFLNRLAGCWELCKNPIDINQLLVGVVVLGSCKDQFLCRYFGIANYLDAEWFPKTKFWFIANTNTRGICTRFCHRRLLKNLRCYLLAR